MMFTHKDILCLIDAEVSELKLNEIILKKKKVFFHGDAKRRRTKRINKIIFF